MNTVDLDLVVKRVASQALRQRQYGARSVGQHDRTPSLRLALAQLLGAFAAPKARMTLARRSRPLQPALTWSYSAA
jgi:hypothetical protein